VLENNKHINLHFVLATARVSLIWLILLSIALGMLLGVLLSQLYRRRRRRH
jgi:NhaP-type Na+/H+ or K+/H+ antiporter